MEIKDKLQKLIQDKKSRIAVIGMGYVGLPLALRFESQGFSVIGIDTDKDKVKLLNQGSSPIEHIKTSVLKKALSRNLSFSSDYKLLSNVEAIIICVPTPLTKNKEPDLSFVISTMQNLLPNIQSGQIISLESTTYPGTTEEVLAPMIELGGFDIGNDFFLVYSPEREDPGNKDFETHQIPKVVSGTTKNCLEVAKILYSAIVQEIVPVSSPRVAELTKLLENIYRSVNIGLVNEMKMVADKMDIDIYEVINAASSKPFGFKAFYPGPGLGGHCIPIDPYYLTWKAKEFGMHTRFIELAGEINESMPKWVIQKTMQALESGKKVLNGSKVLVLGLSYKKDIDDTRESPSVELIKLLEDRGANVDYSDPFVVEFPKMRKYKYELSSVDINPTNLAKYDVCIISTDHSSFNYSMILKYANLIIDTRGVYKNNSNKKIIPA